MFFVFQKNFIYYIIISSEQQLYIDACLLHNTIVGVFDLVQ